jgi:hypothetical protein
MTPQAEPEHRPSDETLAGAFVLFVHEDEFTPEFLAYVRKCYSNPKYEGEYLPRGGRPWSEYWQDPVWSATVRLLILTRGRCEECGESASENLTAHHLTYDYWGVEVGHMESLQCVCLRCHRQITNGQQLYAVLDRLLAAGSLEKFHEPMVGLRDQLAAGLGIRQYRDIPLRVHKWTEELDLENHEAAGASSAETGNG